jgi:thiol-disulfide isomerase/thioredoxin
MKYILSVVFVLFLNVINATAQGVEFQKITFEEAIAKAKKSKKIVFLDLYTSWCGPCKMMDKNVFPRKTVGDFYNANFVNIKIDAETPAGEVLVKKYDVKGYPANLYINPKDLNIISKELGAVDADGFIKRGEDALEEHKDKKSWNDYKNDISKNHHNKAFLERYIYKGNKLGENVDDALDIYVANFKPTTPEENFITFLSNNIKTLNNTAVVYLVNLYKEVPDGVKALEAWLPDLYENTLDRAVALKDLTIIEKIKWAALTTENKDADNLYNRYVTLYYEKMGDWNAFFHALDEEMTRYLQQPVNEYRVKDSMAYADLVASYKAQLKEYGVPENEYMDYINEQTKDKIEAKYQVSYMAAASINDALDKVMEHGKDNKDMLAKSLMWANFMLQIVEPMDVQWAYFGITAAQIYALNGMKDKSKDLLNKALDKANNNSGVRKLILEEMKKIEN